MLQLQHPQPASLSLKTYLKHLATIFRMSLYLFLYYFLIHCVYTGFISYNSNILSRMGLFTAISIGLFRTLMFSAKYQCRYGITQVMQALDGFKVIKTIETFFTVIANFLPKLQPVPYPTCLAHVCYYSDCWRLFDVSFYNYSKRQWLRLTYLPNRIISNVYSIIRYIYQPVMSQLAGFPPLIKRTIGMLAVYAVLCAYHGGSRAIMRWSALNCAQVLVENILLRRANNSPTYKMIMVVYYNEMLWYMCY